MLRLSLDEREDDDVETEVDSLPFVMSEELVVQYGKKYSIALDENSIPTVKADDHVVQCQEGACDKQQ